MALYFCRQKDCTCKSLHYRMLHGVCQDCGHRSFSHFAHFNKHILTPIQRDGYAGDGRRAMFKLKNDILDKCLLRRTKETRAADMKLPPRLVTIRYVRLHPIEGKHVRISTVHSHQCSYFYKIIFFCRGLLPITVHRNQS
jgi:DNA repair protein RAD16